MTLTRDRVIAIRIICSDVYCIERLANLLDVREHEAEKLMQQMDKEQHDFFKRAFGKQNASPCEFDLVIDRDYISEPGIKIK